jgi:MFS family permease
MASSAQSVFRSRSFTSFYIGQSFSYVGDGLRTIAIPLLVYHITGSALSIGITYALELGPFALFGLVGGSLADRIDRRRMMIGCDAIRFAILVLFAIGYARGFLTLPLLYGGIVVIAIAAATFIGGQASSIPYLVGKDRATNAISALGAAEQVSLTVLPPVGGSLFALVGPLPALIVNSVTYVFSQIAIATIADLGPDVPGRLPSLREIGSDIAIGFRFVWRERTMRALAALSMMFNFIGFVSYATWIPYLKRDFGASDSVVGIALGVGAIGACGGSWLAGHVPKAWPLGRMLTVAFVADGLLFLPVAFTHDIRVAIAFVALSSACALFGVVQTVGWRMRVTPEPLMGRVFGAVRFIVLAGTVPGGLLGGAIADRYGAREATMLAAIGYLAMALAIFALPLVRNERR